MDIDKKKALIIALVIISPIILVFASRLTKYLPKKSPALPAHQNVPPHVTTFPATIQGVTTDSLKLKDADGKLETLKISPDIKIYKFVSGSRVATGSSSLSSIEASQEAVIVLDNLNQITSVTFIPMPPALSSKAKSK